MKKDISRRPSSYKYRGQHACLEESNPSVQNPSRRTDFSRRRRRGGVERREETKGAEVLYTPHRPCELIGPCIDSARFLEIIEKNMKQRRHSSREGSVVSTLSCFDDVRYPSFKAVDRIESAPLPHWIRPPDSMNQPLHSSSLSMCNQMGHEGIGGRIFIVLLCTTHPRCLLW